MINAISQPVQSVEGMIKWVANLSVIHAENTRLKQENSGLVRWQAIAKELQQENKALRRLLHVSFAQEMTFRTARIITGTGNAYNHSLLVNSGHSHGIKKYQAVINESGMVGTVIETEDTRSRILLITDMNSRIPVLLERTRERAILAGNNSNSMSLLYVANDTSAIQPGDRIVTSGDGKTLPSGLPVGIVNAVEEGGGIDVQPLVAIGRLDYVRVVDYNRE